MASGHGEVCRRHTVRICALLNVHVHMTRAMSLWWRGPEAERKLRDYRYIKKGEPRKPVLR